MGLLSFNPATIALTKRGKKKAIEAIYKDMEEQGDQHVITRFLKTGERPFQVDAPIPFYDSVRHPQGTLSVVAEYNKKAKSGFYLGLPPAEILGGVLREAGARAVIASVDQRNGGVTYEDFRKLTREQSRSLQMLPGPIPVVWNDIVIDPIQISYAAALGGAAIVLQPELLDDFPAAVAHCLQLKVEPIILCHTVEQCQEAIAVKGVRCLCLQAAKEEEFLVLRKALPSYKDRPDLCFIARLQSAQDFTNYEEIDTAWLLRDHDYNSIWPSPEAIFGNDMADVYSTIQAMRAKAARDFLSPRQFMMERKKEGATEYLGDILY
eukprot:gene3238-3548_t